MLFPNRSAQFLMVAIALFVAGAFTANAQFTCGGSGGCEFDINAIPFSSGSDINLGVGPLEPTADPCVVRARISGFTLTGPGFTGIFCDQPPSYIELHSINCTGGVFDFPARVVLCKCIDIYVDGFSEPWHFENLCLETSTTVESWPPGQPTRYEVRNDQSAENGSGGTLTVKEGSHQTVSATQ